MRLPDFAYQTIIVLQSHKKKNILFFPGMPCLFRAFAKNSKPVIIYFILLRITITISTAQKDDWGNKSEHKNAFFVNKSAIVLLALLKKFFMEHTQKSDEAERHRFSEKKHVEKECHFYLPI
jgi:hypothetical protein